MMSALALELRETLLYTIVAPESKIHLRSSFNLIYEFMHIYMCI